MAARVPIELLESVRPLDVDEYHQLVDSGALDEDDHVELLEGILVTMAPQGPAHANVITRLTKLLVRAAGDAYDVRGQLPVTLRPRSEPEPDFTIVAAGEGTRHDRHPTAALLVIEVALTSLKIDRAAKMRIYATANIPEYWIVDVARAAVEIYTDPDEAAGRYRSARTAGREETLTSATVPAIAFPVSALFDTPA